MPPIPKPTRGSEGAAGAEAILLDCGFTERYREAPLPLGLPVILSNVAVANALSELLGG